MRQTISSIRSICLTCVIIGIIAAPAGADPKTWDGGGPDNLWSTYNNWYPNGVPGDTDDVIIPADTTIDIQMDLGTQSLPEVIASLTVYSSEDGSLTIQAYKGLRINGDFKSVGLGDPTWDVIMEEHSLLDLVDQDGNADLIQINVTMEPVTSGTPSELLVDGAIVGGDSFEVNEGCEVEAGTSVGAGDSLLWGDWTISDGAQVTFENQTVPSEQEPLHMALSGGSSVTMRKAFYSYGSFASAQEHELLYGEGENVLEIGDPECDYSDPETDDYPALTLFCPALIGRGATQGSLKLSLYGKTAIKSYFGYENVREGWDSRDTDIYGLAVDPSVWWQSGLRFEMISTNFEDSFTGSPVIFLDVPCLGAWRDLYLEDAAAETLVVPITDEWNNSITDGMLGCGMGTSGDEGGLFRNIYIGAQRGLRLFGEDSPKLYYYGTRTIHGTGKVFLDDEEVEGDDIDHLIVPAVGTIYGDWNGDCVLSNSEFGDLQAAIAGGEKTYDPLMDYDCDGQLTNSVELPAFLANIENQPPCGRGGGDGGGGEGESWSESYEEYDDVPGLAAWLVEVLTEEELEKAVADLAAAADEFADSPVGEDLEELVFWLLFSS